EARGKYLNGVVVNHALTLLRKGRESREPVQKLLARLLDDDDTRKQVLEYLPPALQPLFDFLRHHLEKAPTDLWLLWTEAQHCAPDDKARERYNQQKTSLEKYLEMKYLEIYASSVGRQGPKPPMPGPGSQGDPRQDLGATLLDDEIQEAAEGLPPT